PIRQAGPSKRQPSCHICQDSQLTGNSDNSELCFADTAGCEKRRTPACPDRGPNGPSAPAVRVCLLMTWAANLAMQGTLAKVGTHNRGVTVIANELLGLCHL